MRKGAKCTPFFAAKSRSSRPATRTAGARYKSFCFWRVWNRSQLGLAFRLPQVLGSLHSSSLQPAFLRAGQTFGEFAMFTQRRWHRTVRSCRHSELLVLTKADFKRMVHIFPDFALGVWRHLRSERRSQAAWSMWDNVRDCFQATHLCRRLGSRIKFGCVGLTDQEHLRKTGCCMVKLLGEQIRREQLMLDHMQPPNMFAPSSIAKRAKGLTSQLLRGGNVRARSAGQNAPTPRSIFQEAMAQSLVSPLGGSAAQQQQKQTTKNVKATKRYQAMLARNRLAISRQNAEQLNEGTSALVAEGAAEQQGDLAGGMPGLGVAPEVSAAMEESDDGDVSDTRAEAREDARSRPYSEGFALTEDRARRLSMSYRDPVIPGVTKSKWEIADEADSGYDSPRR